MARNLEGFVRQAKESGIGYDEFLLDLTGAELQARAESRLNRRIRESKFPLLKPMETFDLAAVPDLDLQAFPGACRRRLYSGAQEYHLSWTKRHRQDPHGHRPGDRSLQKQLSDPFRHLLRPGQRTDRSKTGEDVAASSPKIRPLRFARPGRARLHPFFQGRSRNCFFRSWRNGTKKDR